MQAKTNVAASNGPSEGGASAGDPQLGGTAVARKQAGHCRTAQKASRAESYGVPTCSQAHVEPQRCRHAKKAGKPAVQQAAKPAEKHAAQHAAKHAKQRAAQHTAQPASQHAAGAQQADSAQQMQLDGPAAQTQPGKKRQAVHAVSTAADGESGEEEEWMEAPAKKRKVGMASNDQLPGGKRQCPNPRCQRQSNHSRYKQFVPCSFNQLHPHNLHLTTLTSTVIST